MSVVTVLEVLPECRDLDHGLLAFSRIDWNLDDAEALADGHGVRKEPAKLVRIGARGYVVIFRGLLEQEVPDAAAHDVGNMPRLVELLEGFLYIKRKRK